MEYTNGHSGPGLYAWYFDYPDEGSVFVGGGYTDDDDDDGDDYTDDDEY